MLLAGCTKIVTKINPSLTDRVQDARLLGPTYNDAIEQSIKRKEIIRKMNCDRDILAKTPVVKDCE